MIIKTMKQGSPEWHAARLGLPTASRFSEIITAKTGKPSDSARKYIWELCAEWLLGTPLESASTEFMERGTAIERQAIAAYKLQRPGVELSAPGFCTTDDGRAGCSPDCLVDDDGGLEIKCPGAKAHVGYVLEELGDDHRPQVQGCMWITGRQWWDRLSFHPELPPGLVRWERDEAYIELIAEAVEVLTGKIDVARTRLLELGFEPRELDIPDSPTDADDAFFSPPTAEQERAANRGKRRTPTLPDASRMSPHERHEVTVCYVAEVAGVEMSVAEAAIKSWMVRRGHKLVNFGNDAKWAAIAKEVESKDWVGACQPEGTVV